MSAAGVTSVRVAGLGGMGVLTATELVARAAFEAGLDVKMAVVHGMAQRGGSVSGEVRFGAEVLSPMIPEGEVDHLISLAPEWTSIHRGALRAGATVIEPADLPGPLPHPKSVNAAAAGLLSRHLPFSAGAWEAALRAAFPPKHFETNRRAFALGRDGAAP